MTQITVLSGVERRRHWSDERKLALVEAAIAPSASVAAIARAADISPSSIYRWRRNLCSKLAHPTGFAPVAIHADPPRRRCVGHAGHRALRCDHPCGWGRARWRSPPDRFTPRSPTSVR
ncbi:MULTISPECIES: transposase [unclassified Sphingomonas]|uniref:transposase n=1 Tax=unclassified Sphingomonas TaxID=196159 RepID=UPI000E747917|nr:MULTISPECIES: transposase [unclassified Sphingomonas]